MKLADPIGEVGMTRAAAKAGIIQVVPNLASCPLAEILGAKAPGQVQFFQLYVNRDRKVTEAIVRQAEAGECGSTRHKQGAARHCAFC